MKWKSNAIEVSLDADNQIRIQQHGVQTEDAFVCITIDQAELICEQIMHAAREIRKQSAIE